MRTCEVETEELISLRRIRRLAGSLLTAAGDRDRILRELDAACARHYQQFEHNPQERWRR